MGSPARSVQAPLRQPTRTATAAVRMADDDVDPIDRAFAAAVYLFPITDGIFFGKFLFTSVPVFGALCLPILQASAAFDSIPFFAPCPGSPQFSPQPLCARLQLHVHGHQQSSPRSP